MIYFIHSLNTVGTLNSKTRQLVHIFSYSACNEKMSTVLHFSLHTYIFSGQFNLATNVKAFLLVQINLLDISHGLIARYSGYSQHTM